jgi:16S rRNA (guanine527-N7)-methyltransferase
VPRLWERHLLNCAGLSSLIPQHASVADVGSGAGLPGIVLAIVRPDLVVTLIEPLQRRARFLELAVERLALPHVHVLRARAESVEARRGAPYDVVTARAVAPLDRLVGWCLPLVAPGGLLLAMKGEQAQAELTRARPMLRRAGAAEAAVVSIPAKPPLMPTIVVTMRRVGRGPTERGRAGGR